MPRTRAPDRLDHILDAAAVAFMRGGYRGTRIDQVAELAEVAPGTVYLYVASKEALFDLVIRREFGAPLPEHDGPYAVSDPTAIVGRVWEHVESIAHFPALERACSHRTTRDARKELEQVLRELYRFIARYWRAIRITERCAADWPELHALFYAQLRRQGLARFAGLLQRRMDSGQLRNVPDVALAARVALETISFFAMHRHTAPDSADIVGGRAEETVVDMLLASFMPT